MEPSGINFKNPLQLVFYCRDDDTEDNSPLLMGMAMQDEKGKWFSLKKAVLDSVAETLTAAVHHFSSYVNFRLAKLYPSSASVKVNGSLSLKILALEPLDEDGEGTNFHHLAAWSNNRF